MNTEIWTQRYFYKESEVKWFCPNCKKQSLEFSKDNFSEIETSESRKNSQTDVWEPEWIEFNISGQINCVSCNEIVFFIGKGNLTETYGHNNNLYDEEDNLGREYEIYFTPLFINPTIHLFIIPEKCPEDVKTQIIESFKLYWTDLESCVNKIRVSLEILMDFYNIKKYNIKNNKRVQLTLHRRIELFPNIDVREELLALKWIGNSGSHPNGKLSEERVIDAYRLYQFALIKLFSNNEKEIKRIAKKIIQRKGK